MRAAAEASDQPAAPVRECLVAKRHGVSLRADACGLFTDSMFAMPCFAIYVVFLRAWFANSARSASVYAVRRSYSYS